MTLREVVDAEVARYKRKGLFWNIVGFSLFFIFHHYTYKWGHVYWPQILSLSNSPLFQGNKDYFCLAFSVFFNLCNLIVLNTSYNIIYYLELPFFEQYKIGKGPWPWKDPNPRKVEKWWELYYSTIQRCAFNAVVLSIAMQLISFFKEGKKIP